MSDATPLGVYIHWPYCARVCPYCDFNVVRDRGRSHDADALFHAIEADLSAHAALLAASNPRISLVSLYFGGGTPSLMRPEHVARLVEHAHALWPGPGAVEVTLEANPSDAARLGPLADTGVGRLSLGAQAFDDDALRFLKRDHDAHQARDALDLALRLFPRVSLDLIYALPGQTLEAWRATLATTAALGVEHLSAYQLTVEAGTPLDRARRRGQFTPADEDLGARFYDATVDTLGGFGFDAYEVSNFARDRAARSRHNLVYWRGEAYVGVGPGAHGRLPLQGQRTATEAERNIAAYIARVAESGVGWCESRPLSPRDAHEERILLGLRTDEGVPVQVLDALDRTSALAPLVEGGWLDVSGDRLRATRAGRLVLDSVTGALLA